MEKNEFLQAEEHAGAASQNQPNYRQRVLVADGDSHTRAMNALVLMKSGYTVQTVANGADAWKALNGRNYDLLIIEHEMPVMTGLELINKVRSEDMKLPVILMSGTMRTEELKQRPWLQIQATLLKPHTLGELFIAVKEVLSAHALPTNRTICCQTGKSEPSSTDLRLR
jgi:CheY-like chemotaxis protein